MKVKIKHVIVLLGLPVLFFFQNCGKTNFQNLQVNADSKPTGVVTPDSGQITGGEAGSGNTSGNSGDSGNSKITDSVQWVLSSYSRLGKAISLPEREFRIHLLRNLPGERNCAGDCGDSYRVIGQAFCGAFKGLYEERFDESAASNKSKFSDISPIENASDSRCDDGEKLLETEISNELEHSFQASLTSADTQVTLAFEDGSSMTFIRKNAE